jgi:multimeric flavodoxin WrbA
MKIVVLNGSPKGPVSVTMQYVSYIACKFPEHEVKIFHVAQKIHGLEKNPERFTEIVEEVRSAEVVLWAFPLYILLVSSQYKRFIELISEREAGEAFRGRYAAALSTSINFYDDTAHTYIHGICDDLGMKFLDSYSAHMHDLLKPDERTRLELFARELFAGIEEKATPPRLYQTVNYDPIPYRASAPQKHVSTNGKRVVILSDAKPHQTNLLNMIQRFKDTLQGNVEVYNLYDLDIKGGCLGCLRCGSDYRCAYTGKDGFIDFYNSTLKKADVLIFAGAIVDRQLSWKWRQFFDRGFFNCHTPSLTGKQFAFLISGPLSQLPEMRLVYEAWVEWQRSNLAAFLSDETENASELENSLDSLAGRLIRMCEAGYIRPRTFLGIAGMNVFRDDVWGGLRVIFRADHKAYKRMGVYDFPHNKIGKRILMGLAWMITGLPGIRKRFPAMMKQQMLKPFEKILQNAGKVS